MYNTRRALHVYIRVKHDVKQMMNKINLQKTVVKV